MVKYNLKLACNKIKMLSHTLYCRSPEDSGR